MTVKKFKGEGDVLSDMEWDVKGYFALGGAMHDVAVTVWGMKGWYDFIRPISAIRGMIELGQSSEPLSANYHPAGIPFVVLTIFIILQIKFKWTFAPRVMFLLMMLIVLISAVNYAIRWRAGTICS